MDAVCFSIILKKWEEWISADNIRGHFFPFIINRRNFCHFNVIWILGPKASIPADLHLLSCRSIGNTSFYSIGEIVNCWFCGSFLFVNCDNTCNVWELSESDKESVDRLRKKSLRYLQSLSGFELLRHCFQVNYGSNDCFWDLTHVSISIPQFVFPFLQ